MILSQPQITVKTSREVKVVRSSAMYALAKYRFENELEREEGEITDEEEVQSVVYRAKNINTKKYQYRKNKK